MPDWPAEISTELAALRAENTLLQESMADLQLAAEDRGWQQLSFKLEQEFSRAGLTSVIRNCRFMAIASPLIKRGVLLRTGYVWGDGVTISSRATGDRDTDAGQDVNAVLQAWWDDESNQVALTSSQAQEELERALGTDGNLFLACFTNQLTGRVQVRSTPFEEIGDVVTNPEDREDPWYYLRTYTQQAGKPFRSADGTWSLRYKAETVRVAHPALGYWPAARPKSINVGGSTYTVEWTQPILHVAVNRLDGWTWGIPDVYASLPWARAYEGFLNDWARLTKALSRFAWRLTGDRASKVQKAADKARAALVPPGVGGSDAGQMVATGPGANLEAIPKTGATIDADSGRPLASMVAAGLGLPVTTLLADPGTTGARAVAETLEDPTKSEMGMRRQVWTSVFQTLGGYVIDQAAKAPRGTLRGTVVQDGNRQQVVLAGDVERTVVVDWPEMRKIDPATWVKAIAEADGTGVMPPVETLRLLLTALQVREVDEVVTSMLDEDGAFVDPAIARAAAAIAAQREAA